MYIREEDIACTIIECRSPVTGRQWTITAPSRTLQSNCVGGSGWKGWLIDLKRSDFAVGRRRLPNSDNDGGNGWTSWLKNSSGSTSRLCMAMYNWSNNATLLRYGCLPKRRSLFLLRVLPIAAVLSLRTAFESFQAPPGLLWSRLQHHPCNPEGNKLWEVIYFKIYYVKKSISS